MGSLGGPRLLGAILMEYAGNLVFVYLRRIQYLFSVKRKITSCQEESDLLEGVRF
jgi:hypothetical protein